MAEKISREKLISATYADIQRCDQNGEFERALKAANRILHMEPQEQKAFHCKVVCLIQLGRFDEAVQQMKKHASLSGNLHHEKAYCLYRQNNHHEALKVIDELGSDVSYAMLELKAQILYRIEDYEQSAKIYRNVIKNTNDEYEDERLTNLTAALVFLDKSDSAKEIQNLREDTYEMCFNKACVLIRQGMYVEAEKKLKLSERLCRQALEDEDVADEDIDVDLALIKIQLGYVLQKQGRIKEAQEIYTATLKIRLEDPALIAVASNNVVVINKDQNIFDSKKKIKSANSEQLAQKLPSSIRKYIALNSAIFAAYSNQTDLCLTLCNSVEKTWPDLSVHTKPLAAYNLAKAEKLNQAIELLKKAEPSNKNEEIFYKLCIVHLLLTHEERMRACEVLESLGDDAYRPGIVAALVTVYVSAGREDLALKVFEKTVDWYKKQKVKKGDLSKMWRKAAEFHIRSGRPEVAAKSLQELLRSNPKDKKTIAQLVLAFAKFDVKRATQEIKKLPEVEKVTADVDMEALDNISWLQLKRMAQNKTDATQITPRSSELRQKKKHKKRKGKLPKNYDASITPDPERWLPKHERSNYRKRRDRRARDVIKGSQGTTSGHADQFDFSTKGDETVHETPKTRTTPQAQHQRQKRNMPRRKNKRR